MFRKGKIGLAVLLLLAVFATEMSAVAAVKFSWGPYLRLRHEFLQNNTDLQTKGGTNESKDNRNYFRIKTSLWGQADFTKWFSVYAKLTNEFRPWTYYFQSTSKKKVFHFDINEVFFDQLYVDVKKILNLPVDLRLGRQDLLGQYGENWLIADGTGADGSRSFYFNAAKFVWTIDKNNTIDFLSIYDTRDDVFLPVLNEDKTATALNQTKESAYAIYWKNKELIKKTNLEGYYIFKREDDEYGTGKLLGEKGILNTFGGYAKWSSNPWTLRGQAAYQFGTYGNQDRTGLGGYGFVDRSINMNWKPVVSLGYIYYSGDNPKTDKIEGFNPLFCRFPLWSEIYASTMANSKDTGVYGYWSNLSGPRTQLVVSPTSKLKLTSYYMLLMAPERMLMADRTAPFNDGKTRGQLFGGKADYVFSKTISAYVLTEYFIPGSFYTSDQNAAFFVRTQLEFKF